MINPFSIHIFIRLWVSLTVDLFHQTSPPTGPPVLVSLVEGQWVTLFIRGDVDLETRPPPVQNKRRTVYGGFLVYVHLLTHALTLYGYSLVVALTAVGSQRSTHLLPRPVLSTTVRYLEILMPYRKRFHTTTHSTHFFPGYKFKPVTIQCQFVYKRYKRFVLKMV